MRKITLVVALCMSVFALAIAGCGDSNDTANAPATESTAAANEGKNIVVVAQGNKDLSTLVAALTAGGLVETLQGKGPFTVFAPTNAAFAAIQPTVDKLLKPANKEELKSVLTYHVVPGKIEAADLKDGQELTTVQGDKLKVTIDGDTVKINDATVVQADVQAGNGVVHVIDGVLVPPAKN